MTNKPNDRPSGIDGLANDDPPQKQWRLKCDNDSAARRALYAARVQPD
jgi:hypothetical protein